MKLLISAFLAVSVLAGCGPAMSATIDVATAKPIMESPYWPPARVWLAGSCTATKGEGTCKRPRPRKCRGRYCV